MITRRVLIHPDPDALAAATAARLLTAIIDAQAERGEAGIVLTGGGMGGRTLAAVARSPAATAVDWTRVDHHWGDERFLPRGHPDRNETQARAAMLEPLGIAEERIHAMPASDDEWGDDAATAAAAHAAELARLAGEDSALGVPHLDVLMLGVGPDGHVASLFPGHPETGVQDRTVVPVLHSPKPPPVRLSLTFPVLESAQAVWLVAAGAEKAIALRQALSGRADRTQLPATGATGQRETLVLLDSAAASELPMPVGG